MCYILEFKKLLISRSVKKTDITVSKTDLKERIRSSYKPVDITELQVAEHELIKLCQGQAFADELTILNSHQIDGADRKQCKTRNQSLKVRVVFIV